MEIKKAVITAASRAQRGLPLQTLVDEDGATKSALTIIVEDAWAAGVEEVGIIVAPGDTDTYRSAAGPHGSRLRFVEQSQPRGYGDAVLSARAFVGQEPFLLLVGDHLCVSRGPEPCSRQLVDVARGSACSVSAVQPTHESKLPYYGAVGGRRVHGQPGLYEIGEVLEKPTPTEAEQRLLVPGLRTGHYLCFFGMHVLTPAIFELLQEDAAAGTPYSLSPALSRLARRERYLAFEARGRRYDIGARYGLLHAQLALALQGRDQREVLELILELLAGREIDRAS